MSFLTMNHERFNYEQRDLCCHLQNSVWRRKLLNFFYYMLVIFLNGKMGG